MRRMPSAPRGSEPCAEYQQPPAVPNHAQDAGSLPTVSFLRGFIHACLLTVSARTFPPVLCFLFFPICIFIIIFSFLYFLICASLPALFRSLFSTRSFPSTLSRLYFPNCSFPPAFSCLRFPVHTVSFCNRSILTFPTVSVFHTHRNALRLLPAFFQTVPSSFQALFSLRFSRFQKKTRRNTGMVSRGAGQTIVVPPS